MMDYTLSQSQSLNGSALLKKQQHCLFLPGILYMWSAAFVKQKSKNKINNKYLITLKKKLNILEINMYAALASAILRGLRHEETKKNSCAYGIFSPWKQWVHQHAFLQGVFWMFS